MSVCFSCLSAYRYVCVRLSVCWLSSRTQTRLPVAEAQLKRFCKWEPERHCKCYSVLWLYDFVSLSCDYALLTCDYVLLACYYVSACPAIMSLCPAIISFGPAIMSLCPASMSFWPAIMSLCPASMSWSAIMSLLSCDYFLLTCGYVSLSCDYLLLACDYVSPCPAIMSLSLSCYFMFLPCDSVILFMYAILFKAILRRTKSLNQNLRRERRRRI